MASWLVRSSTHRTVRVRNLAGDIVLCSWTLYCVLGHCIVFLDIVLCLGADLTKVKQVFHADFSASEFDHY